MNRHKNARTTPYGRALMVRRVRELGWSAGQAAEAAGVSVRTVRKWLARHRSEGAAGLLDRSKHAVGGHLLLKRELVKQRALIDLSLTQHHLHSAWITGVNH